MNDQRAIFLVKLAYWLGIGADAIWAIGLLFPRVFALLTGSRNFTPDWELRSVMAMGGVLMTARTILLLWGVRRPIERRFVILLTAFVVAGLCAVALINVLKGNTYETWILIKCPILLVSMIASYILAGKLNEQK